jgi:hypothetical protein
MVRVGEFSDDVCDRLKLKVSMKVTITNEPGCLHNTQLVAGFLLGLLFDLEVEGNTYVPLKYMDCTELYGITFHSIKKLNSYPVTGHGGL